MALETLQSHWTQPSLRQTVIPVESGIAIPLCPGQAVTWGYGVGRLILADPGGDRFQAFFGLGNQFMLRKTLQVILICFLCLRPFVQGFVAHGRLVQGGGLPFGELILDVHLQISEQGILEFLLNHQGFRQQELTFGGSGGTATVF